MHFWQLQEAKAKFSQVVRMAQRAPQMITLRGEETAVVLSKADYDKLTSQKKQPNLVEFLRNSPWYGIELDLERDQSPPRDIDLS